MRCPPGFPEQDIFIEEIEAAFGFKLEHLRQPDMKKGTADLVAQGRPSRTLSHPVGPFEPSGTCQPCAFREKEGGAGGGRRCAMSANSATSANNVVG